MAEFTRPCESINNESGADNSNSNCIYMTRMIEIILELFPIAGTNFHLGLCLTHRNKQTLSVTHMPTHAQSCGICAKL